MTTHFEEVTETLRQQILQGDFAPAQKLAEIPLAASLGVSRTPVRLALAELEREGLVEKRPRRGFSVRRFSRQDVIDAIDVRAILEGAAARALAERGLAAETAALLRECLSEASRMLDAGTFDAPTRRRWVANNLRFHDAIVEAGGNFALRLALDQVSGLPLASPAAILFDAGPPNALLERLTLAHKDHERIVSALERGEGARVEALMREHAYVSRENKLAAFDDRAASAEIRQLPGAELVMAG